MVSFCQLVRSSRYGWGQQALITLEKLQTDETWKNKTKLLPKTATTKNMMTNSNKSNNKMVRLAWDSPQMLMDTWNKWVHHALASIDVWERKKKDETREIRESSSARGAGNKTVTARAAVGITSTADASRYLWATNKLWAQSEMHRHLLCRTWFQRQCSQLQVEDMGTHSEMLKISWWRQPTD